MEMPINGGDQYKLKWNNHLINFMQAFTEYQNTESLVDVTLSCEGQYIKAHKLVLSACSGYFNSIFQVHQNLQYPIIYLNGVRFTDLNYILHFIYHGEVKVLDKDLPYVLALGESLQVKGLSSVKLATDNSTNELQKENNNVDKPPKVDKKAPKQAIFKKIKLTPYNNSSQPLVLPSEVPHINKPMNNDSLTSESTEPTLPSTSVNASSFEPASLKLDTKPKSTSSPLTSIPKTPNAFMIFANEWRKILTVEHPEENNKEISVRLGNMWKSMLSETRASYYKAAKKAEEEYKLKHSNNSNSTQTVDNALKRKSNTLEGAKYVCLDPLEIVETQELNDA